MERKGQVILGLQKLGMPGKLFYIFICVNGVWENRQYDIAADPQRVQACDYHEIVTDISNIDIDDVASHPEKYLEWNSSVDNLESIRKSKIIESKLKLETYLASHPLLWSDGKYYSVTAEKQALLTSNLSLYQLSVRSSSMYNLTWNSTGDECTEWEYEKLAALALAIGQYVKPYVSYQ